MRKEEEEKKGGRGRWSMGVGNWTQEECGVEGAVAWWIKQIVERGVMKATGREGGS